MLNRATLRPFPILLSLIYFLVICVDVHVAASKQDVPMVGPLVRKDERKTLVSTEHGDISAVDVGDGETGSYHLEFMTLEPNSLFLPVLLHADMVLYVQTGSGRLSWAAEDEARRVSLRKGDVYRLKSGTVFFVQSNLEPDRQKLRINAVFANSAEDLRQPSMGAYSSVRDLILGFDKKILQAAFKVPEELVEEIRNGTKPEAIVHGLRKTGRTFWEWEAQLMKNILGGKGFDINKKKEKEKARTFNIFGANPDFENCNGWSLIVTRKELNALKGSNFGVFMVNLTKGSMMGPHWNPMATEITTVLQGRGMVSVVCSNTGKESECKNMRYRVEEGDVFVVPRFHPMAQLSFNNDTLVLMGFSTTTKKNHPQFLAGKRSVIQALDKQIVAASFNVANATIDQLLSAQGESIILECTSCAEEEETIMEEEIEKEREEAREREKEEARRREEEKRREEEESRKREEEEARKEEEEKRRKEEEGEKEAKRREEEEARRREKEEEARKREEEEARKREEQEAREREEEETRKREEQEARRSEEQRQQEEEKRRQEAAEREEEEAGRQEEERRRQEEEEEEEEARRQQEEEAARREQKREREESERGKGRKQHREEEGEGRRVLKKMWKV